MALETIIAIKRQFQAGRMSELVASERLVLKMLAEYTSPSTGECFVDVPTFTTEAGLARRSIVHILQKLEKAGYIQREARWYPSGVQAPSLIRVIGTGETLALGPADMTDDAERLALTNLSTTPDGRSTPYQVRRVARGYATDGATLSNGLLNPTQQVAQIKGNRKGIEKDERKAVDGQLLTGDQSLMVGAVLDWWRALQTITLSANDQAKATRNVVDLVAGGYTSDQIISYWSKRNAKEGKLVPAKFVHDDMPGAVKPRRKGAAHDEQQIAARDARYAGLV